MKISHCFQVWGLKIKFCMENHTQTQETSRIVIRTNIEADRLKINTRDGQICSVSLYCGENYSTFTISDREIEEIENLGYSFENIRCGNNSAYAYFSRQ